MAIELSKAGVIGGAIGMSILAALGTNASRETTETQKSTISATEHLTNAAVSPVGGDKAKTVEVKEAFSGGSQR